ncbi:hypothetical protein FSP39_010969 [Pinctada imbricata]|uniref:Transcriptional coactivator p15 (PC4) C-terminal domain-containing protein n=1 Tax=Pinctada imbricata TaxID=66713 RepID=A0AA89BLV5_PINIB|nr:hypothetical protein FSP39_010969 [Pinctada imbricata]
MSSLRYSVPLENNRFARVVEWNGEPRVDLREWECINSEPVKATKKGVSLDLIQFKTLTDILQDYVDESLKKKEAISWHLGANVFITVQKDNPCVDIRLYWRPPDKTESVPTRRGLCMRPSEYTTFKQHLEEIKKKPPGITVGETVLPER